MLPFNLMSQVTEANQRIAESLQNDSPCRWWLHLFHKLIKYTDQALLGIALPLMDGVHGDFGQSQHTSKYVGLRLHVKYFTGNVRNVIVIQPSVFERVSLCKRKAESRKILRAKTRSPNCLYIHFKRSFAAFLSMEPVISYLCHNTGAGWEDGGETANRTDRGLLQKHPVQELFPTTRKAKNWNKQGRGAAEVVLRPQISFVPTHFSGGKL